MPGIMNKSRVCSCSRVLQNVKCVVAHFEIKLIQNTEISTIRLVVLTRYQTVKDRQTDRTAIPLLRSV